MAINHANGAPPSGDQPPVGKSRKTTMMRGEVGTTQDHSMIQAPAEAVGSE